MDAQTISVLLAIIGLAAGGIWKLTRVESALRVDINTAKGEVEEKQNGAVHMFGESIAAIRQKVSDIELFAANNYVRRDGFYKVQEELTRGIRDLGDKIDERLERMEEKMDRRLGNNGK